MKKIYSMIALAATLLISNAHAELLAVSVWQPNPGNVAAMYASAAEFKAVHERLGAEVRVIQTFSGTMSYSMLFDNYQAWAAFSAKAAADTKLQKMIAESQSRASSRFMGTNLIEIVSPSDGAGAVFETFFWEARPGMTPALIESAIKAQAIHQKEGIHVAVGVSKTGDLVYITSYDDLQHYAKYNDSPPSEAFQAYWEEASKNPSGDLVNVSTGMER